MTVIVCPQCGKVLSKDLDVTAEIPTPFNLSMSLRCPHCQFPVRIEVVIKLEKRIKLNGVLLDSGKGEDRASLRTL